MVSVVRCSIYAGAYVAKMIQQLLVYEVSLLLQAAAPAAPAVPADSPHGDQWEVGRPRISTMTLLQNPSNPAGSILWGV